MAGNSRALTTLICSVVICLLLGTLLEPDKAHAAPSEERIISYHNDITINPDSTIYVVTTIKVYAEGNQIGWGITPYFRLYYDEGVFGTKPVDYRFESITMDGTDVPYSIHQDGDQLKIPIGDKTRVLLPGEHEYVIKYTAADMLRYEGDRALLYYSVSGGWTLKIDTASAKVTLPASYLGTEVSLAGYTGSKDNWEQRCEIEFLDGNVCHLRSDHPLAVSEQMRIRVGFPAGGFSAEPNKRLPGSSVPKLPPGFTRWIAGLVVLLILIAFFALHRRTAV